MHEALDRNLREGPCIQQWVGSMEECRRLAARLLNGAAESVAFLQNTAQAISTVARGIGFAPGDQVLVPAGEYPANVYPWLSLADQGVETVFVQPDERGWLGVERFAEAVTPRTRLVAVSFVQFGNGYRVDYPALARFCHERGALLLVDAVQGLGALPFDVTAGEVDFVAAGSHKWLLSPPGIGILYVAPRLIESLSPVMVGALNVQNPLAFDTIDYRLPSTARRFESGTANFLGFVGMEQSLRVILDTGIDTIGAAIRDLVRWTRGELTRAGFAVHSPDDDAHASGIISFSQPGVSSDVLAQRLHLAGVIASLRKGRVRLSPHWYTTREQIQRCIDAVTAE
jgi:selenocysteine lyase/cysteine desulfurase